MEKKGPPKANKPNVGYNRILSKPPQKVQVTTAALPLTVSVKDKLICFMTGENEEERLIRTRLIAYLKLLQGELQLNEKTRKQHYEGGKKLHLDFEKQKIQLQKWGLMSILPAFQMQAWLRVSRAQLVVEMSSRSLLILKSKIKHTELVTKQLVNDKDKDRGGGADVNKKQLLSPPTMSSSKSTGDLGSSSDKSMLSPNVSHRRYTESLNACIAFCQPVEGTETLLLSYLSLSPSPIVSSSPHIYIHHNILYSYTAFLRQPIKDLVEQDATFSAYSGSLLQLDYVCGSALRTFQVGDH